MAYIDNFDEETIIDVATQYGSFMNAEGDDEYNPNPPITPTSGRKASWRPPVIRPTDFRTTGVDPSHPDWRDRRRPDYTNATGRGFWSVDPDTWGRTGGGAHIIYPADPPLSRTRQHLNPVPTEDLHRGRKRMWGTPENPTAGDDFLRFTQAEDFRNQTGSGRANLGGGASRFENAMRSMGCNGLNSRKNVLQNKLSRFDMQGIRPQQQIKLQEKINFIDNQLLEKGCYSDFSGSSNLWMSGDY